MKSPASQRCYASGAGLCYKYNEKGTGYIGAFDCRDSVFAMQDIEKMRAMEVGKRWNKERYFNQ